MIPRSSLVLVVGLAALAAVHAGCAGGGAGAGATGPTDPIARAKEAVLSIEAHRAGARPFPFPVVSARVGDKPTKLLVDTSASAHALERSLGAASDAAIDVDGWGRLAARPALVDLPAHLREHGVGGVIAPQLLAESGEAVVVDLVNRRMRLRPTSTARSDVADIGASLFASGQGPLCPGADGAPALLVDAEVDGARAQLAVDTGASRTLFLEGSAAAARAAAHPVLGRSMGQATRTSAAVALHAGVPLRAGAWSTTMDVGVAPGERQATCSADGRLGMDALQYCAIAVMADAFVVACRTPGG